MLTWIDFKAKPYYLMNKNYIIIVIVFIALIFAGNAFRGCQRDRDVEKTVITVLDYWKTGDLTLAMNYWVHAAESPPVYGLTDYQILSKEVSKSDAGYVARVIVKLEFSPENKSPSGKEWLFVLNKTRYGWKITKFHLI
jgi:hypothetical protein